MWTACFLSARLVRRGSSPRVDALCFSSHAVSKASERALIEFSFEPVRANPPRAPSYSAPTHFRFRPSAGSAPQGETPSWGAA